jgi:hypothetical protein
MASKKRGKLYAPDSTINSVRDQTWFELFEVIAKLEPKILTALFEGPYEMYYKRLLQRV